MKSLIVGGLVGGAWGAICDLQGLPVWTMFAGLVLWIGGMVYGIIVGRDA